MKVLVTGRAGHWFLRIDVGFGDCSIALVLAGEVNKLSDTILHPLFESGFKEPIFNEFLLAAGAEVAR